MQTEGMLRPEDCVTFQVALIGTDGLVVGSDRKAVYPSPAVQAQPVIQRTEQPKFKKNKTNSIVSFYAGGADSAKQASEISRHVAIQDDEQLWESSLENASRRVHRIGRDDFLNEILVSRNDRPEMLWLIKSVPPNAVVSTVSTVFCTGTYSDARFLAHRFFRHRQQLSELRKLALLTLAYAANDNSGSIGGSFDLMTLDRNRVFSFEHYESLTDIFSLFDKSLADAFEKLTIPDQNSR